MLHLTLHKHLINQRRFRHCNHLYYINDKIRSNPDGLQIYWVYKNKYLILSLLNSDNNLSDINIYYYPIYWKNNR